MIVSLSEIEPFNIPTVDSNRAALFIKHLTGGESFSFDGAEAPKSMMIYSLEYNYPHHSFANSYLLSINIDTYDEVCSPAQPDEMEDLMKKYIIGTLDIEFGGTCPGIEIRAKNF